MTTLLNTSTSLCPECLKVINAEVIVSKGRVYIEKSCPLHGQFSAPHPWSDPRHYKVLVKLSEGVNDFIADGLVINLNSICNQHCPFCFARANESQIEEPSIEEIVKKVSGFPGTIIYLSGGEPTLRADIAEIIKAIKLFKRYRVFLFTNGKRLTDKAFVCKLKESGVDLVILQFDTFDNAQSLLLRGEQLTEIKLDSLANLKMAKIPVYLFVMLLKGVNTDQIERLIDFASRNSGYIKLLNFNPVWRMGRFRQHDEFDASSILIEIENILGCADEEFFNNTIFSYYLFKILKRLLKKKGNQHPKCEMRCYMVLHKNKFVLLGRICDIERVGIYLEKINSCLDSRLYYRGLRIALSLFCFLLKEFLSKKALRAVVFKNVRILLKTKFNLLDMEMISIIVGTFHNNLNIDLNFVKTCNLFSDYPGKTRYYNSSCIRQLVMTNDIK